MTPPTRDTVRRLDVESWPDDSGHRWRRLYFDGLLVDVDCADCGRRPMELLLTNLAGLAPCHIAAVHTGRAMSLRCLIGRHDWEPLRYWEVDGAPEVETLVEGPVCRRCRTCARKGRRVIQRVYPDAARRWTGGGR